MEKGIIFDIKRYAIHDGPGIRTTVFFKGCPLHCPWCHNPEGISPEFELIFKENRCLDECQVCLDACPQRAISRDGARVTIDRESCQLCGTCVEACPAKALEKAGEDISVAGLMDLIQKDKVFFEESGGGVTFSGGEPLLQPAFLAEVLEECCQKDIHACLDTCGFASTEVLESLAPMTGLFLFDLKMIDDQKHQTYTGVSNSLILNNLKYLAAEDASVIVRIPLIPGINDDREDIRDMGEFIRSLDRILCVDLLPYHDIAAQKYVRLDRIYESAGTRSQKKNWLNDIRKELEAYDLDVRGGESG
jgi:pyruvate formate lyase activating enzyme